MKKLARNLVTIGLLGGLALFVSGCDEPGKYTGGGMMKSSIEEGAKANFGFNMKVLETGEGCGINQENQVKGQLQYKDHGRSDQYPKGLKFHGVIESGSIAIDQYNGLRYGDFEGKYTVPGNKNGGGWFYVSVHDEGEPGPSEGDVFVIYLSDGVYDGYSNDGLTTNGNIKFHPVD